MGRETTFPCDLSTPESLDLAVTSRDTARGRSLDAHTHAHAQTSLQT